MTNFLKKGLIALLFLALLSCTDLGSTTSTYKIINGTSHAVELCFYKGSIASEDRSFVFKEEIEVQGLIVERTLKTYALDIDSPIEAFKADSIALIFNKERVEGHTFNSPIDNSLLDDYERNGNQFTYTITEENYNNAIPCDGLCD